MEEIALDRIQASDWKELYHVWISIVKQGIRAQRILPNSACFQQLKDIEQLSELHSIEKFNRADNIYDQKKHNLVTEIDNVDDYNDDYDEGYDEAYAELQQMLEDDKAYREIQLMVEAEIKAEIENEAKYLMPSYYQQKDVNKNENSLYFWADHEDFCVESDKKIRTREKFEAYLFDRKMTKEYENEKHFS